MKASAKTYAFISSLFLIAFCKQENKSPYVLQATYDSGPSSSFAFRKDGTFEWTNGSGLGVFTHEGKYSIQDSIITLDEIGFDKVVKSKRLLITSLQPNSKQSGRFVIQVNAQNRLVDSMFIFNVYWDKRDSL